MNATEPLDHDLGDRLRRIAPFADRVPPVHFVAAATAIDKLAILLGRCVADAPDNGEDG